MHHTHTHTRARPRPDGLMCTLNIITLGPEHTHGIYVHIFCNACVMMMVIIMIQRNPDGRTSRRAIEGRAICPNVACVVIILNSGPMRCGTHTQKRPRARAPSHGTCVGTHELICNASGETARGSFRNANLASGLTGAVNSLPHAGGLCELMDLSSLAKNRENTS